MTEGKKGVRPWATQTLSAEGPGPMTTFREDGHPGCSECTALESSGNLHALRLVSTLRGADLFPQSASWRGRLIEVRECARCGRNVARAIPLTTPRPQIDPRRRESTEMELYLFARRRPADRVVDAASCGAVRVQA